MNKIWIVNNYFGLEMKPQLIEHLGKNGYEVNNIFFGDFQAWKLFHKKFEMTGFEVPTE